LFELFFAQRSGAEKASAKARRLRNAQIKIKKLKNLMISKLEDYSFANPLII